jgi:hypothetical protein
MVAKCLMITGQTQNVSQPQRVRAQQITLHPQAVAVTAGHLDHRLKSGVHRQRARANG